MNWEEKGSERAGQHSDSCNVYCAAIGNNLNRGCQPTYEAASLVKGVRKISRRRSFYSRPSIIGPIQPEEAPEIQAAVLVEIVA